MQRKFAVVIDDRMTCIGSALKPDDDIGLLAEHVRDLTLAFVTPVCSYNCSYHVCFPPCSVLRIPMRHPGQPCRTHGIV